MSLALPGGRFLAAPRGSLAAASPIIGLSLTNIASLLEEALREVEAYGEDQARAGVAAEKDQTDSAAASKKRNYYCTSAFQSMASRLRAQQPPAVTGEAQIFVTYIQAGFSVQANEELVDRIKACLKKFRRPEGERPHAGQVFTRQLLRDLTWIIQMQLKIVRYLCEHQQQYVLTGDIKQLRPLLVREVAQALGYSPTTIYGLTRCLSVQLPSGETIWARRLTPDENTLRKRAVLAVLTDIAQDPKFYKDGKWKVPSRVLSILVRERTGHWYSDRAVRKLREGAEVPKPEAH